MGQTFEDLLKVLQTLPWSHIVIWTSFCIILLILLRYGKQKGSKCCRGLCRGVLLPLYILECSLRLTWLVVLPFLLIWWLEIDVDAILVFLTCLITLITLNVNVLQTMAQNNLDNTRKILKDTARRVPVLAEARKKRGIETAKSIQEHTSPYLNLIDFIRPNICLSLFGKLGD